MAREALMTLDCSMFSESIVDILMLFDHIGWRCSENEMEYLPLGDKDMFEWRHEALSYEKLFSIIAQKQKNKEMIGLTLYYEGTDIGITFLATTTEKINISPDINRVMIKGEYTDISWYIERITVGLEEQGCIVESMDYSEYIG